MLQGALDRLYARLGPERYVAAYYALVIVASIALCALAVIAFKRYHRLSGDDLLVTLAVAEGCIGLVLIRGVQGTHATLAPLRRWFAAGRPAQLAAEAWTAVVLFGVRFALPHFGTAVLLAVVPVTTFGLVRFDFTTGETIGLAVTMVLAGTYPALLWTFAFEIWFRPVVRELAVQMPPEHAPSRAQIPLRLRLAVAVIIISVTSAFFVGVLRAPAELHRIGLEALLAVGVGVGASLVPVFLATEAILGPVGELEAGTRRVRAGDFATPVPVLFTDELGVLAGAFNEMTESLQRSREQAIIAREEERRRVSRDLHDGLGPTLAAMALRLQHASRRLPDEHEEVRADLEALRDEARAAVADVRRLVYGLRPPALDDLGLVGALEQVAAAYRSGDEAPAISIRTDGELPSLPAAVEVAALRIAQEAMTNSVRHARAGTCEVAVRCGRALELDIRDNGAGIDRAGMHPGVGIASMRERAEELGGTLELVTPREGGTLVRARLPVVQL